MKFLKVGWDACIGAGQCTCHAFLLPLWHILDNFVNSQVKCSGQFFIGEKINAISSSESESMPIGAAVENDILYISRITRYNGNIFQV